MSSKGGRSFATWAASTSTKRTATRPCLVSSSWCTVRSELRTFGVGPAQAHSLRASGNREMFADLGDQGHGGQQPDARLALQGLDPGVGLGQLLYLALDAGDGQLNGVEERRRCPRPLGALRPGGPPGPATGARGRPRARPEHRCPGRRARP